MRFFQNLIVEMLDVLVERFSSKKKVNPLGGPIVLYRFL